VRTKQLGIVCIKVVVEGRGGCESTEGVVYMMKSRGPRTKPWGHRRRRYTRTKKCYRERESKEWKSSRKTEFGLESGDDEGGR